MNFLVVDDTATMRKIIGMALRSMGHQFIEAENGQEALDKVQNNPVDFFIVDINMPVMNGLEFVKHIKGMDQYRQLPILIITTEHETDMIDQGKSLGVNHWMIKPFQKNELMENINQILQN